ncbi:hypothetical protein JHK85_014148 [Glycine max]|nr:hypothetical protein JHK85_014148 [Glycine max]
MPHPGLFSIKNTQENQLEKTMMMKMWNWYQNSLSVHPVKTQAISSAILWGVGDLSAQYITHSAAPKKLLQLSLLYVNFYLLDCAFLSWLEQQKDAPWKKLFASFHSTNEKGGHRCGEG